MVNGADMDRTASPLRRRRRARQLEDEFRAVAPDRPTPDSRAPDLGGSNPGAAHFTGADPAASGQPTARVRLAPPPPPPPATRPEGDTALVAAVASARSRDSVLRFRRAAVAMALEADHAGRSQAEGRECAAALADLAVAGHEHQLAGLLRADPAAVEATWTVACYQIGDLSPSALRDFAEVTPAVLTLVACETAAHVAAELIVTNGDSVRWTALVRSGSDLVYQPLSPASATAPSEGGLREVRNRWEDQLLLWASDPGQDLDPPAISSVGGAQSAAPESREVADPALGAVLGQVLEAVRHLEERLPEASQPAPGQASSPERPARADTDGHGRAPALEALAGRLDAVEAELARADRRAEHLEAQLRRAEDRLAASEARTVALRRSAGGSGSPERLSRRPALAVLLARWLGSRLTDWAGSASRRGIPQAGGDRSRPIELVPADEWGSE